MNFKKTKEMDMENSPKGLSVAAKSLGLAVWMVLALLASAGAAAAADQGEFAGEVVRVAPDAKQMILRVPNIKSGEVVNVTVQVGRDSLFQGVQSLSDLKEGAPVKVQVRKSWYGNKLIIRQLVYAPSKKPEGLSPTDKAQLHDIENKSAQGQMGDVEFETKRQELEK